MNTLVFSWARLSMAPVSVTYLPEENRLSLDWIDLGSQVFVRYKLPNDPKLGRNGNSVDVTKGQINYPGDPYKNPSLCYLSSDASRAVLIFMFMTGRYGKTYIRGFNRNKEGQFVLSSTLFVKYNALISVVRHGDVILLGNKVIQLDCEELRLKSLSKTHSLCYREGNKEKFFHIIPQQNKKVYNSCQTNDFIRRPFVVIPKTGDTQNSKSMSIYDGYSLKDHLSRGKLVLRSNPLHRYFYKRYMLVLGFCKEATMPEIVVELIIVLSSSLLDKKKEPPTRKEYSLNTIAPGGNSAVTMGEPRQ